MDKVLIDLLQDMKANPQAYGLPLMRRSLGFQEDNGNAIPSDTPLGRYLATGRKLDAEMLVQEGIIPDLTYRFNYRLRYKLERVSVCPENFAEVLFIGAPGSGKTSVLAGIIDSLYKNSKAFFRCTADNLVIDRSAENCIELIHGIRDHYFPARANQPFVRYNMLDADNNRRGWSFVDLNANNIGKLTQFQSSSHGLRSIDKSLETPNRKVIFFVIDTEFWQKEDDGVTDLQDIFLTKALTMFLNDGPNNAEPSKGCTFSRTRSVVVLLSKSDIWRDKGLGSLSLEEYLRMQFSKRIPHFISELKYQCKKYGINKRKDDHLWVYSYSAGRKLVGNLLQASDGDAWKIVSFLLSEKSSI